MVNSQFCWFPVCRMATSDMSCGKVSDLFGYIPCHLYHNHATKEFSRRRCVRSKKQQTSQEMLNYRLSERRYYFTNEGSFSLHSNSNDMSHTQRKFGSLSFELNDVSCMQLRWTKYGWSSSNLFISFCKPTCSNMQDYQVEMWRWVFVFFYCR